VTLSQRSTNLGERRFLGSLQTKIRGIFFNAKNMKNNLKLTKPGLETLRHELEELLNVKRPKLVERLANARSQGDLSENSDYQSAKEELEFLDGRIDELTEVVKTAAVVSIGAKAGKDGVTVGTKVTVKVNGAKTIFDIVGEWEADPINKKISHDSPLGIALSGKKVGDKVEVEAPAGKLQYEILAIE
jgi:transcription elongation factor GreA